MHIDIARTADGRTVSLPLRYANRHGLITGSTGSGKTTSLQRLAEEFSRAGVPVVAADIKGDLSGVAAWGQEDGRAADRARDLGLHFRPDRFPVAFWDLFGRQGLPLRTSVEAMGDVLLARMLDLNQTQAGTLAIAFQKSRDERAWMMDLDDLHATLDDMRQEREEVCARYGNVTGASISTIQRQVLALRVQGGDHMFGEPPLGVGDFMRTAGGRGVINLLVADRLVEHPLLYATFLLNLLTELFRALPEAGDLAKPKMVFFFDEAHLLFRDAPKALMEVVERLVRLVRSKGVGVWFVTQAASDVPDTVLAQLGNRVQHALRAYTPKDQRMVKASAKAFRPNPGVDVEGAITTMGVGEALVSFLVADGVPSPVERVRIIPPAAQIGPVTDFERAEILRADPLRERYAGDVPRGIAAYRHNRRMTEAFGGDPGPDTGPAEIPADFYRQFLPDLGPPEPKAGRPGFMLRALPWALACLFFFVVIRWL